MGLSSDWGFYGCSGPPDQGRYDISHVHSHDAHEPRRQGFRRRTHDLERHTRVSEDEDFSSETMIPANTTLELKPVGRFRSEFAIDIAGPAWLNSCRSAAGEHLAAESVK